MNGDTVVVHLEAIENDLLLDVILCLPLRIKLEVTSVCFRNTKNQPEKRSTRLLLLVIIEMSHSLKSGRH